MKAAFHTFGCRLNQLETEALANSFSHASFTLVPLSEEALIYVINTCTVTSKSEQKARGVIRKKSRENPNSIVIVTGCYAQMEEAIINDLGHNVFAVPLKDKDLIQDYALYILSHPKAEEGGEILLTDSIDWFRDNRRSHETGEERFRFVPDDFTFHTRAFLKIQDGCDNECAYCRVTLARGASISLSLEKVIERVKTLEEKGYQEVTLTGVNIDSYQWGSVNLAGLLENILEETHTMRVRLSSLDPDTFTPQLAQVVAHERVCSYFHLSAQSGSDRVLKEMNRNYGADQIFKAVELLRETKDNPYISADIIVGFPGESGENFQDTRNLMEKARFASAHIFPYSPRPGTPAFDRKDTIPESTISERTALLRAQMSHARQDYSLTMVGKKVDVIWEKEDDYLTGISDNYLTCRRLNEKDDSCLGSRETVILTSYNRELGLMECAPIGRFSK